MERPLAPPQNPRARNKAIFSELSLARQLESFEAVTKDEAAPLVLNEWERGMSVKEALALRFTNYNARLPKRASNGPQYVRRKKPRVSAEFLDNLIQKERRKTEQPETVDFSNEPIHPHVILSTPYELEPFWRLNINAYRGLRGHYVNEVKYVSFNGLIHRSSMIVSMKKRVPFLIHGKEVHFNLLELLYHNGIIVKDYRQMQELKEVFTITHFMVHHKVFSTFINVCGPLAVPGTIERVPIELSERHPPFANFRSSLWLQFFGSQQGVNRIGHPDYGLFPPSLQATSPIKSDVVLSPLDQLLVIVQDDASCSPDTIARTFGISKFTVETVLQTKERIVRNSARILLEQVFDEEEQKPLEEELRDRSKVRRSSYVGLNALMWRFFKDCASRGIVLNGKILRQYSLIISQQIGLTTFKGSEGWLDGLKKRHRLDMKAMTGCPSIYEEDEGDPREELEAIRELLMTKYEHIDDIFEGQTGSNATALVSIESTAPLDLTSILGLVDKVKEEPLDEGGLCMVKEEPLEDLPLSSKAVDPPPEMTEMEAILQSVTTHIPNVELSFAVDTIRSFLVANDQSALPLLVQLQHKLAQIARSRNEKPSTSSPST